ncbi:MAG: UbiA family prenyltransferase, partial [Myxococcota bacterium]
TYAALWTARLLGSNLVIQPFLAALVLVNVDALLDPVVATAHNCVNGMLMERPGIGLGFWRWYIDPRGLGEWYGVPIFNFAVWFAAPLFLISLVNVLGSVFWPGLLSVYRRTLRDLKPSRWWQGMLLLAMACAIAFVHWIAPKHHDMLSVWQQKAALVGLLGLAVLLVFAKPAQWTSEEQVDFTLTRPASIALAIPALALLFEGFFVKVPQLIPVGLFALTFALIFAFAPYRRAIRTFCDRVGMLDRFIRLHYFGFSSMLILLGAGLLRVTPDKSIVGGLLLVALCFHIWSYVSNDVADLELDRTQPRRSRDPLVNGTISRATALAVALVQIPLALLVTLHLVRFQPENNPWAFLALATGFGLILAYNLWGKTFRIPPVADLIQGFGWGSLVVFGALIANRDHAQFWLRTIPLVAYASGYILLVSGVLGGLRDLSTDERHGKRTTALFFGARPGSAAVECPRGLTIYAFTIHTLMFLLAFAFLWRPPELGGEEPFFSPEIKPLAWAGTAFLLVLSNTLLVRVVRPSERERDFWMSALALVLLMPPLWLYAISETPDRVFTVVVGCCFFVPLLLQEDILPGAIRFLYRDLHPFVPSRLSGGHLSPVERQWVDDCNLHDLAYWEGGILGGLVPWWRAGRWEWRYAKANLTLTRSLWRLWDSRVRVAASGTHGFLLTIARTVLPAVYAVASMLFGWTTWSLTRRELVTAKIDQLGTLSPDERGRLERWI